MLCAGNEYAERLVLGSSERRRAETSSIESALTVFGWAPPLRRKGVFRPPPLDDKVAAEKVGDARSQFAVPYALDEVRADDVEQACVCVFARW